MACAKLVTALDAQDVLDGRDGERPGRGAWEAGRDLTCELPYGTYGYVVAAEGKGGVDPRDHPRLWTMWRERSADRAWLRLLGTWLKAGRRETDGLVGPPETGSPQGGCRSPVLAHGDGHDALDLGCATVVTPHGRGQALWGRAAAAGVCACRDQADAERCSRALPQRVAPFNLQGAPDTTHLQRFRRVHPSRRRRVTWLGGERSWRPARQGVPRGTRRPARKTRQAACRRITAGINQPRHRPGRAFSRRWNRRLRGHDHSDGRPGNARSRSRCVAGARRCPCNWRQRRGGQRQSVPWEPFAQAWDRRGRARPRMTEVTHRRVFA